ncbi:spore germination protein [Edaphobacillus lindanitolerans]|uniref:Spore germination protein KA n=1 Tax=Edaphobacillus lindanitolerans TaxID=550447 RepID=A0A1U7PN50_9BACI|nr:spore germination protein [Edaphobacillus lindanitolerans]SIT72307.1 spore germination protein KA [Edaphobacillus lindanitolerans]
MSLFDQKKGGQPEASGRDCLQKSLQDNLLLLKVTLGESTDVIIREIRIGREGIPAGILYTDGLTDTASLQKFLLETLMIELPEIEEREGGSPDECFLSELKERILTVGEVEESGSVSSLLGSLLSGDTLLLVDGYAAGLVIPNRKWAERAVTEPNSQTVVRGPRDSFSENIRVNSALIRRRVKDPNLWNESRKIGTRTETNVELMYIHGLIEERVLDELRKRLDLIEIDGILESGYIEEFIQDTDYTMFPTIYNTERPDAVAANLLEGRIAILVDGSPFVLIVPALFTQFFQSSEDYYQRVLFSSFIRILRYVSFGIAMLLPAFYIAITTFHPNMLPPPLLISLAAQREGVPFPAFIEALIMELAFEILREAGLRMPRNVGSAISIVGAMVIGTAAVEAGIISAAMVIVVSLTAIANFVSPVYDLGFTVRMLRFGFMILAGCFGFYGIMIGLIVTILHLCSLRSFGVPYMSPLSPFNWSGQKDTMIRGPIPRMYRRPRLIGKANPTRQQPAVAEESSPDNSESKR